MVRHHRHRVPVSIVLLTAALCLPGAGLAQQGLEEPASQLAGDRPEATDDAEGAQQEARSATGDAWMDAQLADIDRYARRHPGAFIDELVRYRDAPRTLVAALLDERGWVAGDVYFACSLASVTGRSCRFVADQREKSPVSSWSELAAGLGAGVGSEGFFRLKREVVDSYRRWARPLELDAELTAAFPDHGKPPPAMEDGS